MNIAALISCTPTFTCDVGQCCIEKYDFRVPFVVREAEEDSEFGDDRIAALIRFVRADLREFERKLTIN